MINLDKLSPEQRKYAMDIQAIADGELDGIFMNSGVDHAKIVLATIFDKSKHELRIFAESLTSEVAKSGLYIDSLIGFLGRGGTLKVLVQENKLNENPYLKAVFSHFVNINKDKVILKTTKTTLKDNETKKPIHFTVGDDHIYRLEKDISVFKAFGSFKDNVYSKTLIDTFDDIFGNPSSLQINLIN